MRRSWTQEQVDEEAKAIAGTIGRFPTNAQLREMGRGDLSDQISRRGGFRETAKRLGIDSVVSDSDTGWAGEHMFCEIARAAGFKAEIAGGVKYPFDVLLNDHVRIDVKSTGGADYVGSKCWYFRIGKVPTCDFVVLLKTDSRDFYAVPWMVCPHTNVSIGHTSIYDKYKNDWSRIRKLLDQF